jgi:hypothetical protein
MGGFAVTIPIILTFPPSSLPLNPCPTPFKAIARDFLVLFHIGM